MKEIKAFFYIFYKSLTSFDYYKDVIKANNKLTIKYFILLGIFGALITTTAISFRQIPQIKTTIEDNVKQLKNQFPQDLEIQFNNNEWSINQPEPYVISFPKEVINEIQQREKEINEQNIPSFPKNIVVINHEGTIGDLETYDALIVMNAKNLIIKQSKGVQTIPLKDIPNTTIDKEKLASFINNFEFFLMIIPYAFALLLLFILLGVNIVIGAIYVFAVTGILWLLGNFLEKRFLFSGILKIAVHTMTFIVVVQSVFQIINFNIDNIMFFLANILIGSIVMVYLNKNSLNENS